MVVAAAQAGVGEIALESGFRSYSTQQTTYGSQVGAQGVEQADLSSARPGFSEHQSGLAADVVPCGDGCGTLDDLAGSTQGQWLLEHAWEYGWITRYEDGHTATTGYMPEPWHLRYIGPELARSYRDGGFHTLEDFLGLPAAPTYLQ
jgi:D-alanyl-D-alanine carboxypeptidase